MRIISWNVNGIRALVSKGFHGIIEQQLGSPDMLCLQETKAQNDQVIEALANLNGYHIYSNSAVKKGYSGVAILSKKTALNVQNGIGLDAHDQEGRVLTLEFETFYLLTVYTPNSQNELARLPYRQTWDAAFKSFVIELDAKKPVIICGDLNVAHQAIDIARPQSNYNKSAGYTQVEIDGISALLDAGFIDTFRQLNPDQVKYSWWSFRANARMNNIGWRIDYFLVSQRLQPEIQQAYILDDVSGSDHCPVGIKLSENL
jgi:exodeoxyribonuclease-3